MAGKLPETANIIGGTVQGANLIDNAQIMVEEDTARLPSFYRALAVTAADDYLESKRIARATISGPGASVAGKLRTRAPVDTAEPVVQKYEAEDGTWRRKSTSETTWSGWIQTATDTGLGSAAAADVGNAAGNVVAFGEEDGVAAIEKDSASGGFTGSPGLQFYRTKPSAVGVAGDVAGVIDFWSERSDGELGLMGRMWVEVVDPTFTDFTSRFGLTAGDGVILYCQAGLYTKNTADNGTDSLTARYDYIHAAVAPGNPATSGACVLYVDQADGNKLKAKHSNGTVTTISTP